MLIPFPPPFRTSLNITFIAADILLAHARFKAHNVENPPSKKAPNMFTKTGLFKILMRICHGTELHGRIVDVRRGQLVKLTDKDFEISCK